MDTDTFQSELTALIKSGNATLKAVSALTKKHTPAKKRGRPAKDKPAKKERGRPKHTEQDFSDRHFKIMGLWLLLSKVDDMSQMEKRRTIAKLTLRSQKSVNKTIDVFNKWVTHGLVVAGIDPDTLEVMITITEHAEKLHYQYESTGKDPITPAEFSRIEIKLDLAILIDKN